MQMFAESLLSYTFLMIRYANANFSSGKRDEKVQGAPASLARTLCVFNGI
jgi:hypothetical protein